MIFKDVFCRPNLWCFCTLSWDYQDEDTLLFLVVVCEDAFVFLRQNTCASYCSFKKCSRQNQGNAVALMHVFMLNAYNGNLQTIHEHSTRRKANVKQFSYAALTLLCECSIWECKHEYKTSSSLFCPQAPCRLKYTLLSKRKKKKPWFWEKSVWEQDPCVLWRESLPPEPWISVCKSQDDARIPSCCLVKGSGSI